MNTELIFWDRRKESVSCLYLKSPALDCLTKGYMDHGEVKNCTSEAFEAIYAGISPSGLKNANPAFTRACSMISEVLSCMATIISYTFSMTWYVYIATCSDNTLYTGITTDVERRKKQHNREIVGGAKYTSTRNPVVIDYIEEKPNRSEASAREYEIKCLSREEKLQLLSTRLS